MGLIATLVELFRLFWAVLALIAELKKKNANFNAKDALVQATDAFAEAKKTGNTLKLSEILEKLRAKSAAKF